MINEEHINTILVNSLTSNFKDLYQPISKLSSSNKNLFFKGLRVSYDSFINKSNVLLSQPIDFHILECNDQTIIFKVKKSLFLKDIISFSMKEIINALFAQDKNNIPWIPSFINNYTEDGENTNEYIYCKISLNHNTSNECNNLLPEFFHFFHLITKVNNEEFLNFINDSFHFRQFFEIFCTVFPEAKNTFSSKETKNLVLGRKKIFFHEDNWDMYE